MSGRCVEYSDVGVIYGTVGESSKARQVFIADFIRGLIVQPDPFILVSGGRQLDPLYRLASPAIQNTVGRLDANLGKAYP